MHRCTSDYPESSGIGVEFVPLAATLPRVDPSDPAIVPEYDLDALSCGTDGHVGTEDQ